MAVGLVRKWSDVGAPKLWANTFGSFTALLKAVLVDGYGSFAPLGWTLEYTSGDNTRAVFRNSQIGTGTFFRVNHSNDGRSSQFAEISSYESVGSIDDFSLTRCPFPGSYHYFPVGSTVAASCPDGIHWYIIGDNLGFWILWRPLLSQYVDISTYGKIWHCAYYGDYLPINITNKKNWFQCGVTSLGIAGLFGGLNAPTSVNPKYSCMRGSSFDIGSVQVGLTSGSVYETADIGSSYQLSPINGVIHFSVPILHDYVNSVPNILGFLPGLVNPLLKWGNNGVADTNLLDSEIVMGNKVLRLFRYRPDSATIVYDTARTIGIFSGEGFRNVL